HAGEVRRQGQLRHRPPRGGLCRRGARRRLDRIEGGNPARRRAHGFRHLLPDGRRPADRARERDLRARRKGRVSAQLVLAPGLWMPGAAMGILGARLSRHGYRVRTFGYRGRAPYESNLEALARFADGETFFVGHSLGGVLILDMLNRHPEIQAQGAVLLVAPVRGCLAGRRFGGASVGRWMMGPCRALWEERPARWSRRAPLGVVAGTTPFGLGRMVSGRLPGLND